MKQRKKPEVPASDPALDGDVAYLIDFKLLGRKLIFEQIKGLLDISLHIESPDILHFHSKRSIRVLHSLLCLINMHSSKSVDGWIQLLWC